MESQVIYKYRMPIRDEVTINMPKHAQVLTMQMQHGILCVWCLIQTAFLREIEERTFNIYETGNPVSHSADVSNYIATVQDNTLVWHIFEH